MIWFSNFLTRLIIGRIFLEWFWESKSKKPNQFEKKKQNFVLKKSIHLTKLFRIRIEIVLNCTLFILFYHLKLINFFYLLTFYNQTFNFPFLLLINQLSPMFTSTIQVISSSFYSYFTCSIEVFYFLQFILHLIKCQPC